MRRVRPTPFPQDPLMTDAESIGAAIRAVRTNAGLTLIDAAISVGVSKQTLSDLETGKASVGLRTAMRVARELGVSLFAVPATEREPARRAIRALRQANFPAASPPSRDDWK